MRKLLVCVLFLAVSAYLVSSAAGQATTLDPCTGVYKTYSFPSDASLNDSTKNFGFSYAWINEYNNPPLCLQFVGVQNRRIQILVETISSDVGICIKDQGNAINNQGGGAVDYCSVGTLHSCFNTLTNQASMNVYIYCGSNCPTSGFALNYRAVLSSLSWDTAASSPNSAMTQLDMWCMNEVASVHYQFPSNVNPETTSLIVSDAYSPSQGGSSQQGNANAGVAIAPTPIAAFLVSVLFAAISLL